MNDAKKTKTVNIALDGPSGAGKSYLAHRIADELHYTYVDTGALYRSIGLYMVRNGIDPKDKDTVVPALENVSVTFTHVNGEQHVFLNGEDVNGLIRTPEISMAASAVSAIPEVRTFLLSLQREIASEQNVIMDGRDIGTVILPNADVKIFLCASDEARAKRRYLELKEKGMDVSLEEIKADMAKRDKNDREREVAPAVAAPDAVVLDNSELDRDGTVKAAIEIINSRIKA